MFMLDMVRELEKTLHLQTQDLPYLTTAPGMETRVIHARVEDDFFVTQIRAAPYCESGLHKHAFKRSGASGYTLRGRWGHDRQYLYGPGMYIFETPDVIHQFFNGPEESEVLFFGDFAVDFIDPVTLGVKGTFTPRQFMDQYLGLCAEKGITPNFLTR
jgi:2,4'-dihydroxyacetophenone dioxygenase